MRNKFTCHACEKEFEETPSEYGGYDVKDNKEYCRVCWSELIEIKNRHNRELDEWLESKKTGSEQ